MTTDRLTLLAWVLTLALLAPLISAISAATGIIGGWQELRVWAMVSQTITFAGLASLAGLITGYMVGRAGLNWAAVACIPMVLPSSLLGSAWIVALGRMSPLGDWVSVFDWPVAAVLVGLRYMGIPALIIATQRRGSGAAARVFHIKHRWWWLGLKPALAPASVAFLATFILVSADHVMPSIFLVHTYGTQVLIQYNALQDLAGAAALATPMLVPAIFTVGMVMWILRPQPTNEQSEPARAALWPAVAVLLLAVGVPLSAIVIRCGSWAVFTESFGQMRPEAIHTALLMLTGSVICAGIGCVLAQAWLYQKQLGRWSPVPLILLNLAAPPSMLALGLIDLSSRAPLSWLRDTDGLLILSYVVRLVPLPAIVLFIAGLRRPRLPAIAACLYQVSFWRQMRGIHWPAWRNALGAAVLLCALMIATELESSLMLAPAGTSTLGVRLYTLIHTAPDTQVSAASLAVLVMLSPMFILLAWALWRRRI